MLGLDGRTDHSWAYFWVGHVMPLRGLSSDNVSLGMESKPAIDAPPLLNPCLGFLTGQI